MEINNRRKMLYIVVSILLALFVWFFVSNSDSVTIKIDDIRVEFLNEERGLASKGMVLVAGDDSTVDLELTMPRSLVYGFDPEKVRIVSDLNAVTSTGTQTLRYSILYPSNISASRVTVKSPSMQTVDVQIGELFRRNDIEIRCRLVGNLASGYIAGTPQLLPEKLEIRGEQSDIMSVSYAQVTMNIDGAHSTLIDMLSFELFDENDQPVTSTHIHPASSTIQVTVPVTAARNIPLRFSFIESAGVRLESFDYSLDHEIITVSGDAGLLSGIDEIVLDSLDLAEIGAGLLSGGEEKFTRVYDIASYLPAGTNNISGFSSVTLSLGVGDLQDRTYEATQFDYERYDGDEDVSILTESLPVTLRGAADTLDDQLGGRIRVVADLSGVEGTGTRTVPAQIRISGDPDVAVLGEYEVSVYVGTVEPPEEENGQAQTPVQEEAET